MAYKLESLNRVAPDVSYNDFDDFYVYLPYRKNNSIDYRNFVKSHYGKFDPIEIRWSIKNCHMTKMLFDDLKGLNMLDGLKYVMRNDNPLHNVYDGSMENICDVLKTYKNDIIIAKEINFDRRINVQYFSINNSNFVIEIFIDTWYKDDYDMLDRNMIQSKILRLNMLPKEYARTNWKHYVSLNKEKSIRDVSVTSIQQLCDRFLQKK
jgi:hypothetical protein